jgi:hypothetical protein
VQRMREGALLCMRGPNGGRSLCLDCGRAWLRQQPSSGSKRCTGCGAGWRLSKEWLTDPVEKNTVCTRAGTSTRNQSHTQARRLTRISRATGSYTPRAVISIGSPHLTSIDYLPNYFPNTHLHSVGHGYVRVHPLLERVVCTYSAEKAGFNFQIS